MDHVRLGRQSRSVKTHFYVTQPSACESIEIQKAKTALIGDLASFLSASKEEGRDWLQDKAPKPTDSIVLEVCVHVWGTKLENRAGKRTACEGLGPDNVSLRVMRGEH